jgi:FixJ family two-component response regulator
MVPSNNQYLVVVVEDDDGMRQAICRVLEVEGFTAKAFVSAEALLAAGAVASAHCLVLDIRLPGMSGFELQRQLSAAGRVPPVVFITAHDVPSARRQAVANAGGYLVKPFPSHALVEAVNHAIDGSEASPHRGLS